MLVKEAPGWNKHSALPYVPMLLKRAKTTSIEYRSLKYWVQLRSYSKWIKNLKNGYLYISEYHENICKLKQNSQSYNRLQLCFKKTRTSGPTKHSKNNQLQSLKNIPVGYVNLFFSLYQLITPKIDLINVITLSIIYDVD